MKRIFSVLLSGAFLLSLIGCTMEVNPPATPLPESMAPSPTLDANQPTQFAGTKVPITWSDLNLTGKLVYSTVPANGSTLSPQIQMLDLGTGELTTLFAASDKAWIHYLAVSPDGSQLVMSYSPPSQPGSDSGTGVYILPLVEAAVPAILFEPPTTSDRYIQVEWSPDGRSVYLVHYNHAAQPSNEPFPAYQISRMAYPGGQPEPILEHAFWPRLSADSTRLVYITMDPGTGLNKLFLANADGSDSQEIQLSGLPAQIIDAPIFSADGESILFSMPSPGQAYQPNWLDRLMGAQIAKAHNVPSDWWSVPILGGSITRLTQIQTIKLFASISPDGRHIASLSGEGILVMGLDGSNLRQLLFDPGVMGTLRCAPLTRVPALFRERGNYFASERS